MTADASIHPSLVALVEELLDGIGTITLEALEGRIREVTSIEHGERGWAVCVAGVALDPRAAPADAERQAEQLVRGLALAYLVLSTLRDQPLSWEEVVSAVANVPARRFHLSPDDALRVHQAATVLDALAHEGRVLRAPGPERRLDLYVASGQGWSAGASLPRRVEHSRPCRTSRPTPAESTARGARGVLEALAAVSPPAWSEADPPLFEPREIADLRALAGLTQAALSAILGCTAERVGKLERGIFSPTRLEHQIVGFLHRALLLIVNGVDRRTWAAGVADLARRQGPMLGVLLVAAATARSTPGAPPPLPDLEEPDLGDLDADIDERAP